MFSLFWQIFKIPRVPSSPWRAGVEGYSRDQALRWQPREEMPGSWQVSGDEGRKEVKDVSGEWEEDSPPPPHPPRGGLFMSSSSASFCSSLLSSLPWDRNLGPRNQQHKPLRPKPLWFQTRLWVSCSPFHLRLCSLFLTMNSKTGGRGVGGELEDKLVCQPRVTLPSPLVSELVSLPGKRRWKSEWLAVWTPWWASVGFIGEDLPF